jgi:hypothetical protein
VSTANSYFTIRSIAAPAHHEEEERVAESSRRLDEAWDSVVEETFPGIKFESWSRARGWASED